MENKLFTIEPQYLKKIKKIIVFGDIHGDLLPFSNYLKEKDLKTHMVLFLGDYADRGKLGVESIHHINTLITKYPGNVIALKGNHEDYNTDGSPCFNPCDLVGEATHKKGSWKRYFKSTLAPFIEKLFISALLPGNYFFVHGGISSKITDKEQLKHPSTEVEKDILWSDPFEATDEQYEEMEYESYRGLGVLFGRGTTEKVCRLLDVKQVIRSHQPRVVRKGIHYNHDGMVITVNSTSVYQSRPFVLLIDPSKDFAITSEFI